MRLRDSDLLTAKPLGSDGECPAPTADNPVTARPFLLSPGRGAGRHGLAPGLANAARASASPASGARGRDGAGDLRARPVSSIRVFGEPTHQPFHLSAARSSRAFCAGVRAFHLSGLDAAFPLPYPRPGFPAEPEAFLLVVDLFELELLLNNPIAFSHLLSYLSEGKPFATESNLPFRIEYPLGP